MDDRRAHFLTMLGDACVAAGIADIPVELLMNDGSRVTGTPSPQPTSSEASAVDDTGYAPVLLIDGARAQLDDVVEFVIRSP